MAIDTIPYPDSETLASHQKSFYPLKIPVSHWQLRHYISHPEPDTLYYASGADIYHLNTATRKRKHIAALPFEARCTASGYGYVCVGGEDDGKFAVIKLEDTRPSDVDSAVPLDYWREHGRTTPHAAGVTIERTGVHIVNSISIHRIHDEEAHVYDVVAVLTNNDQTVRIYSLVNLVETAKLELPDAMNHATISPDGKTLAAVGDVNTCYFFERYMLKEPPQIPKPHNRLDMCAAGWRRVSERRLYVPSHSAQRGYFTTAWSPRGHLLAVGSEAGYITVFDMESFGDRTEEGAVQPVRLATVGSTRPNLPMQSSPGAVRSMIFSPDPWDLLIWAEDQGRICVGDLRTGLRTKQVINLDPKDDALSRIMVEDVEPADDLAEARRLLLLEEDYIRRRMGTQGDQNNDDEDDDGVPVVFPTERAVAEARRAASSNWNGLEDDPNGLTSDEAQVLDALRTTRQREEARASGGIPRSVNYTSSRIFSERERRHAQGRGSRTGALTVEPTPAHHSTTPPAFPYLSRQVDRMSGDYSDVLRTANEWQLPALERLHRRNQGRSLPGSDPQQPLDAARQRYRMRRNLDDGDWGPQIDPDNPVLPPPTTSSSNPPGYSPPSATAEEDQRPWRIVQDAMDLARGPLFDLSPPADTTSDSPLRRPPTTNLDRRSPTSIPSSTDEHVRALAAQRDRLRNLQRHLAQTAALAGSPQVAFTTTIPSLTAAADDEEVRTGGLGAGEGFTSRYELLRDVPRFEASWDVLRRREAGGRARVAGVREGRVLGLRGLYGVEVGVRTAGLATSRDGRTVWVATEEGIFEVGVRVKERMVWPALELR